MRYTPKQLEALKLVAEGRFYPDFVKEDDGWHARWHAAAPDVPENVDGWVDEFVREAAMTRLSEDAEDDKHETLHDAWMMALRSRTGLVRWNEDECKQFAAEIRNWNGNADDDAEARRSVVFSFSAAESVPGDGAFVVSCRVPRGLRALRALGQATYVWGTLRGMRRCGDDTLAVELTRTEAEDFLRTGARDLRDAGYSVVGVDLRAMVAASAELVDVAAGGEGAADPRPRVKLTVRVAGQPVTGEEIRFLLEQKSTLVFFRDHWIEVDRNILKEALRALERGVDKNANLVSFAMGIGRVGRLEIDELKAHGWLRGLVNELRNRSQDGKVDVLDGDLALGAFAGSLRDYQKRGVAWLRFLADHGFGALLADDMGLGKTIQTIAWMQSARRTASAAEGPFLVVAPLTLLSNWRHEIVRFAPDMRVHVHQGEHRHVASGFRRAAAESDVVLTSYNLLVRDHSFFAETAWRALVLDEAQAVKNPDTQVARAIRALMPRVRIALTGTPVENSVEDLWALEDFLNPGFLGDRSSFRERFAKPIALDPRSPAAKRLRHALEPFVLRRLKTDAEIAAEIGEKRELRAYCALPPEARRAYERALADYRATEKGAGDVFSLITSLKLVCDGLSDGAWLGPDASHGEAGGKFERLVGLLEEIFSNGESALVFTQYATVGAKLQEALQARFGRRFPYLHGSLSPTRREEEIRRFNARSPRGTAFILSLRAGGYGLNLTKATHVIHYDRWWNPAVESQATDRAHRIGQSKDVFVHLLISEGTLEEHIDELLSRKATLKDVISDEQTFWKAVSLTPVLTSHSN